MVRVVLLLLAGLAFAQPGARPIELRDVDGRPWWLLAPPPAQFDLLFFISSDCPISNRYAPAIVRMCRDYQPRGVRCFTIYPDLTDARTIVRHRQEYGLGTIPAILDRDYRLVRAVGPRVTPEAAIYSAAGRLYRGRIDNLYIDVGRSRRAATRNDARLALDEALAGRAITMPETEAVGCVIQVPSGPLGK